MVKQFELSNGKATQWFWDLQRKPGITPILGDSLVVAGGGKFPAGERLEEIEYGFASAEDFAREMMEHNTFLSGAFPTSVYTRECVIYCPDGKYFLAYDSPLLDKDYSTPSRSWEGLYLPCDINRKRFKKALKNSVKLGRLGKLGNWHMKPEELPKNNFFKGLFRDSSEKFSHFLRNAGVEGVGIYLDDLDDVKYKIKKVPYATQVDFHLGFCTKPGETFFHMCSAHCFNDIYSKYDGLFLGVPKK